MMAGRDVDVVAGAAARGGGAQANARYPWTDALKARFLDHLAATCNVSASARAIGASNSAVHGLRRRDAAFASDWGTAIEAGYQLLETHLVGIALATSGAVVVVDDGVGSGKKERVGAGDEQGPGAGAVESASTAAPGAKNFEAGYRMLRHRATERARGWRGGSPPLGISTRQDTDAEILKKLAALAARRSPA
ncbi:hypothetical protein [Sphingomonas sp.]|uniref:hypothetical protein n=1 Tax=Sphingomonas sp. TaxID=28214 RepID=UPI0039C922FB